MLDFSDLPYAYFEAEYSHFWAPILRMYNKYWLLPRKHRVSEVVTLGGDHFRVAKCSGAHVMIVPNHPTHSDASIVMEAVRQHGGRTQFMAAYDVFLRNKIDGWVMQKMGAFSVDREASDTKALKAAAASIEKGQLELTIFPEGNVYLENERLTPFHDGAAVLAARSGKKLKDEGKRLVIVPVSIKASYEKDVTSKVRKQIGKLQKAMGCEVEEGMYSLEALGKVTLERNLRQRGYEVDTAMDMWDMLEHGANQVLEGLERKLGIEGGEKKEGMERVRECRRKVHEVLSDPEREIDHKAARGWADEAMVAMKIMSYSEAYVKEKPTIDRVAETTEKLAEDVYGKIMRPFGTRKVWVKFGEPIDVTEMMSGEKVKLRKVAAQITSECEKRVQAGIDEICSLIEGETAGMKICEGYEIGKC
ncbi:1-acyl-sn-glycerol-3-phosphate acyltransferase [Planctomycetota bacterium]|nr:1-acyl-sn-glycerol-3-phosphate acyltransferase [Planctomycetota bacterium]